MLPIQNYDEKKVRKLRDVAPKYRSIAYKKGRGIKNYMYLNVTSVMNDKWSPYKIGF